MNDLNFNFTCILQKIRALKVEYDKSFSPFFDAPKMRIILRKSWRDYIYSLDIYQWQKDYIWEYLNGYVDEDNIEIMQ